mgnify:CR=1 FL=1
MPHENNKEKVAMKNIAVFASGQRSNFQAIIEAVKKRKIKANISLLVCDNSDALVIDKAKRAKIKVFLIERKAFSNKDAFESQIINKLNAEKIDLIVLAGFMRVLSARFVSHFKNKIINIHPAKPKFPI